MQQCARQLTDPFDGFLLGKRYLIHDRDTKFTQAFDALLKACGVEPLLLPLRSPDLNAHCEQFVRSIKEEALDHMVMLGEAALSYAIQQYLTHYHAERNHQGLGKQLIAPEPGIVSHSGQVRHRERLVGLLHYYRDAAWRYYATIRDCYCSPRMFSCNHAAYCSINVRSRPIASPLMPNARRLAVFPRPPP